MQKGVRATGPLLRVYAGNVAAPLNPGQLRMFMSPRDVAGYVTEYGDLPRGVVGMQHDKTGSYKVDDARASGMYDSIATEGVKHPIEITHDPANEGGGPALNNGHHRMFAQAAADPDRLMPVIQHDRPSGAVGFGRGSAWAMKTHHKDDPTGEANAPERPPRGWHKLR